MAFARSPDNLFFAAALCVAPLIVAWSALAVAQQVDLSLNLDYDVPNDPNSGGTWTLVGKSSQGGNFGIASVSVRLLDISMPTLAAPRGVVPGDEFDVDEDGFNAGFNFFLSSVPVDDGGFPGEDLSIFQLGFGAPEDRYFYGVGTLFNGAPNYAGQPAGTNSVGPMFAELSDVVGEPWGVPGSDYLGQSEWDIAVPLATGLFEPGMTPSFSGVDDTSGATVFDAAPAVNQQIIPATIVEAIVRSNLNLEDVLGDYNLDGFVNAADYTVWRDTLGDAVPPGTGADGDGNGAVDGLDYDVWKSNYGRMVGLGGSSAVTIPEPEAVWLAFCGLAILLFFPGKTG